MQEPGDQDELFFDQRMTEPKSLNVETGSVCVFSNRCPGKTSPNEDSAGLVFFEQGAFVLVVADGVGGGAAGESASRLAVKAIHKNIRDARGAGMALRTAIINGIEIANEEVRKLGGGAATTLAVVEFDKNTMRPYHVGDSSIVVIGGRGKIKMQTLAHSPVGYAVEAGLIDEQEALEHEDRHVVSNVVGDVDMRIDIGSPMALNPRDIVLLASDGVTDNLAISEIAESVERGPLGKAAARICDLVQERMSAAGEQVTGKPDDVTFFLFRRVR